MSFSQSLHSELTLRANFLELLQFHLCLQTSHVCLLQGPRRPHKPSLVFSECIFFESISGVFSKILLCILSGVKEGGFSTLYFQLWKKIGGQYLILNTNLCLSIISLLLYKSSVLLYVLAFIICWIFQYNPTTSIVYIITSFDKGGRLAKFLRKS